MAQQHWRELQAEDLRQRFLAPKTAGQHIYWRALHEKDVVLCSGQAGTGKSLLSVGAGINQVKEGVFSRLIITRPMIACGQGLGYLPGELKQKIAPYMKPVLDILYHFLGKTETDRWLANGTVEVNPMEVLRGLTFANCYVLADEMQGAEYAQLHMLITRLGDKSRLVINGDASQTDLSHCRGRENPLLQVMRRLRGLSYVQEVWLTRKDVLRHPRLAEMDDRLSGREGDSSDFGEVVIEGRRWLMERCSRCDARMWFPDTETDFLTCWQCGGILFLPEDTYSPPRLVSAGEGAVMTYYQPR